MNNLLLRTLSGVILVLIILGAILAVEYTMLALVLVIFILGFNEFRTILQLRINAFFYLSLLGGAGTLVMAYLLYSGNAGIISAAIFGAGLLTMLVLCLLMFKDTSVKQAGQILFGFFWIAGCLLFFMGLGWLDESRSYKPELLIILFVFIWTNDVAAYLIGSALGRHPLAASISPSKTWEGFIGGMLFNGLAGYLVYRITGEYSPALWIVSAMLVSLGGTAGDLFESKLKREAGVKDSGRIIPGHGGILDRFDSLLFSAPIFYILFLLWHQV